MTKYVNRYWKDWYKNVAPAIKDEAEEKNPPRRKTLKMCEEDPEEDKEDSFEHIKPEATGVASELIQSNEDPANMP